jgi:hypothetical protein
MEDKEAPGGIGAAVKALAEEARNQAAAERYYVPGLSPLEIRERRAAGRWDVLEGGSTVGREATLGEARRFAYGLALARLAKEVSSAKHRALVCERSLGLLGEGDPFLLGRFMDGGDGP